MTSQSKYIQNIADSFIYSTRYGLSYILSSLHTLTSNEYITNTVVNLSIETNRNTTHIDSANESEEFVR